MWKKVRICLKNKHTFTKSYNKIRSFTTMSEAKTPNTNTVPFNNGLTPEQVETIRGIFSKVNVDGICRAKRVKRSTIDNVLRGKSPRIKELNKVLAVAKRQVEEQENELKSLAL